jgi:hypothetical protein
MQNETILLSDLLNGLVELDARGDNPSPQHFTPPPPQPFDLTAVNGEINPTLPMRDYLNRNEIGSSTFAAIQRSELALQYEIANKGNGETKSYYETGTAVHSYLEAWSAGVNLDDYLATLQIMPTFSRGTTDGVVAELEYYTKLLGVENFAPPKLIADKKVLADELRKECEKTSNFVSEKDADVIKGIAAEMQRRHSEKPFLDWLQFAKSECTFFWQDFKCRPDLWLMGNEKGLIVSVKTCARIDKAVSAAKYDYGIKEAFYRYIIEQVTGVKQETVFLFFETVAPFQSRLIYVSEDTAEYYDQQVEVLIEKATRCLKSGKFRGYEANLENGVEVI